MWSTARRLVNGRFRQKEFSIGNLTIANDRAPKGKRKLIETYRSKNPEPPLYAPVDGTAKRNPIVSNTRIKYNQEIEKRFVYLGTQADTNAIAAMADREGGAMRTPSKENAVRGKTGEEICPGDYVMLFGEEHQAGVVLPIMNEEINLSTSHSLLLVSQEGYVSLVRETDVVLCFPLFVQKSVAVAAASPELAKGPAGLEEEAFDLKRFTARAEICKRLSVLHRMTEEALTRMTPAFEALFLAEDAQHSLEKLQYLRMPDVAKQILEHPLCRFEREQSERDVLTTGIKPKQLRKELQKESKILSKEWQAFHSLVPSLLLATHRLLFDHPELFVWDSLRHRETQSFTLRPRADRVAWARVRNWVKDSVQNIGMQDERQGPITSFAAKARKIIEERRLVAERVSAQRAGTPGSVNHEHSEFWDANDLTIIQCLRAALGKQSRVSERDVFKTLIVHIVKLCGVDYRASVSPLGQEGDMGTENAVSLPQKMAVELLQKLGFLTPWENVVNMDTELRQLTTELESSAQAMVKTDLSDFDGSIREDFHGRVYVIDDSTAKELDDGISIESTSNANVYWVHVLIADPTAGLNPHDDAAKLAAQRLITYYLPEGHWPMLPSAFADPYGLRVVDVAGQGRTTGALRISAKVDARDGSVRDYQVASARLKDVRVKTYEAVDWILAFTSASNEDETDSKNLAVLDRIASALEQRRRDVGGAFVSVRGDVSVHLDPLPLPASPIWQVNSDVASPSTPIFTGFPHIRHSVSTAYLHSASRRLVSEMMILAGRVTSLWASERQIPLLNRMQPPPQELEKGRSSARVSHLIHELRNERGIISLQDLLKSRVSLRAGGSTLEPGEHFAMGIRTNQALKANRNQSDALSQSGYVRVTSPLRRYPDLLNHWQIKAYLREKNTPSYPFSKEALLADIPRLDRMEKWAKQREGAANQYWMAVKLFRGLHSRRGGVELTQEEQEEMNGILDGIHPAVVTIEELRFTSSMHGRLRVQLTDLGIRAELRCDARAKPLPIGTVVHVKIQDVFIAGPAATVAVVQAK